MGTIIGRKNGIRQLTDYYNSGRAEFIAIYGRRRIGKTFLLRNVFRDRFSSIAQVSLMMDDLFEW